METKINEAQADTEKIITDLLEDGSDPDALYLIEHHISSDNFTRLEKAAIEAFQLGYEIAEPEECIDDQRKTFFCFDIISEIPLDATLINQQIAQIIEFSEKFKVNYDGWGTYFEDGESGEEPEES